MENPPGLGINISGSGGSLKWGYEKADLRIPRSAIGEAWGTCTGMEWR